MVVCPADHSLQADVIFVVESTAINGAYINDLKSNYIIPSLEYFSQGNIDDSSYLSENTNSFYGIVTYQAADCLPRSSSDTIGPFSSPAKLLTAIDKLELIGGKGESHANIAEGLATTLQCFEELQQKRDSTNVQKHCILICNSPPYLLPVFESQMYVGKTAEQLVGLLQEKNINLSIISPRKIPSLYKLFEKAGGDLTASQTKNYAKDPRHLVLLRGFSLKERPLSPPPGGTIAQQPSMPSPLADSPSNTVTTTNTPNYRPTTTVTTPQVGMTRNTIGQQPPPGYHNTNANLQQSRPPSRWPMLPPPQTQQQRPYIQQQQQTTTTTSTQGSALIAQLTQPPSTLAANVNQFAQMGSNIQQQQQQQQMKINMINAQNQQQNVQATVPQQQQQQAPITQVNQQQSQVVTSQAQQVTNPQMNAGRERHNIWQGSLEWLEKPKNPSDQQKITKHVPCQVSTNSKDGEPELKAENWPPKLIMQLMPKQLIGSIGGAYLKNSKSVLFHPQQCEALESLTKVMSTGFAGCVHFTSNNCASCDIKVLILLYTTDKRAYLGFIPNDQAAFVDRLRKVIQQQKSTQLMRQTQNNPQLGGGNSSGSGTPPQQLQNPVTSQQTQQGLMMSQTNTMAMGGGQITQNVAANATGPNAALMGQAAQMQPRLRMQGIQQPGPNQGMQPNLMGGGGPTQAPPPQAQQQSQTGQQRGPFENQLQVERQQNLEKINQLKQTLEAAQQQEQQYKSQLERISHMKTTQLQEALQIAQQTEMQYKMLDQQRMANQSNAQAGNAQPQQRMMRPVMGGNPGLRHLLQQQPQYRQQIMGMQQQMGGNGPRQQLNQQLPNTSNQQQNTFDDVPYDFM